MKTFISFLCGAAVILAFNALHGANPSHHVYELRMYHVNPGKTEALQARFRDHTDAIFKWHNMKSVGYWVPEDAPGSQNLFICILEHPSRQEAKKQLGRFPSRSRVEDDEGRIGSKRSTRGSHRSVLHGPHQLFGAQLNPSGKREFSTKT